VCEQAWGIVLLRHREHPIENGEWCLKICISWLALHRHRHAHRDLLCRHTCLTWDLSNCWEGMPPLYPPWMGANGTTRRGYTQRWGVWSVHFGKQ